MKAFFSAITRLSLRFWPITLLISALVSVAGVVAVTGLQQELIPAIEFPQTIIFAQVTGMTSDQVLQVVTERIEAAVDESVPQVVNIESQTTGTFGAVITARNDFGFNQARIQDNIQAAIDGVWLPLRRIAPPESETGEAFAAQLLGELTPDVMVYLASRDANFLFQLAPDVWAALPDETVAAMLGYLAAQTQNTGGDSALRQLVEQEIVPALTNLEEVASVTVSGGQALPQTGDAAPTPAPVATQARSLLLQLSPEVWTVAAPKAGYSGALDDAAAPALAANAPAEPDLPPALPSSWQLDRFKDAGDLREMQTLTRTLGAVFNTFVTSGEIVGSLGQTDDLTPDVITQMLAIDPTLVEYFDAEQLAALSPEVFAALPSDFIANLDGFTRDELAARALAASLTGETSAPPPVDLPSPWRIPPPQLISFSFDDLPLATFSISGAALSAPTTSTDETVSIAPEATEAPIDETTDEAAPASDIPEGPGLPFIYNLIGAQFGVELNSADDLINLQLAPEQAAQFGTDSVDAATLFNFLILLGDPDALPEGVEAPAIAIDPSLIIGGLSGDAIAFLSQYDPNFLPTLSADVYNYFSDEVLALDAVAPPLDTVWNTLAEQPQFANQPLRTAADVVALGDGTPSSILNRLNENVPETFAGYEVRLFNSLSPATLRYFALREPDFYTNLTPEVLLKLSPAALAALPDDVLNSLDEATAASARAIASGEQESAAQALSSLYELDAPPADPNAPALNSDWAFIGDFLSVELDTADDFFRFFPDVTGFLNSFWDSAQGAAFAPRLFGGLTPDMVGYMLERDPAVFDELRIEALQLMTADTLAALPQTVQDRAVSGAAPFTPTDPVTRTNGNNSLFLTVYKSDEANTVEAYHRAEESVRTILASYEGASLDIAFEQASFIEESISGVAREGGLGAIFAIVVILVFLSSGRWAFTPRRIVGAVLTALFLILLVVIVGANTAVVGGDFGRAWDTTDVLVRAMLILGVIAGLFILLWPGTLPRPAWRSTIVTAVSIPLSVLVALALMRWLPPTVNSALAPAAEGSSFLTFILRLFPASLTINIMTLSGLTVAIGRVVDDSIVVLENIFRQVQEGGDKRAAILQGTRDVSVAIFAATVITVVVFLPLGLTGGIIGEFFLPFGLAVTYALLASFIVAITVVPVVAYLLLDPSEMPAESHEGWLERLYLPALRWALAKGSHRAAVLGVAVLSLVIGGALFASRPQAFLPDFGEPQIAVAVSLPAGTRILDTNAQVEQLETYLRDDVPEGEITRVQTIVGSSGFNFENLLLGQNSVDENIASVTLAVEDAGRLDALAGEIRERGGQIFGEGNVSVSAASLSEQGFGGFALVLSGSQADLEAINQQVIDTLNNVEGLANVSSNLAAETSSDAPPTYIRIDGQSAAQYTGELETSNTLGVTNAAKAAVLAMPNLPATVTVSEGFNTRLQTEGFANLFLAMGIAIAIVIVILIITFGSFVHWLDIILSIIVAPVGAAIALTLANRVLGISALIGLLMLIGIVVTNAVVLIDRVQSNKRERGMNTYDALVEAGGRRLRPILMTAIATITALIPLAIGLSQGAIIASELGTVVIGGLFSSTLLTLLVVPVAYILLDPLNRRLGRRK